MVSWKFHHEVGRTENAFIILLLWHRPILIYFPLISQETVLIIPNTQHVNYIIIACTTLYCKNARYSVTESSMFI